MRTISPITHQQSHDYNTEEQVFEQIVCGEKTPQADEALIKNLYEQQRCPRFFYRNKRGFFLYFIILIFICLFRL